MKFFATLAVIAIATTAAHANTFVQTMKEADATHMYLGPTNAGDQRTVKEQMMDYNDEPKGYEQGWTDGWNWAIKRAPFEIQESLAEEYATGKYGTSTTRTKTLS
jgi:hypothetical protein